MLLEHLVYGVYWRGHGSVRSHDCLFDLTVFVLLVYHVRRRDRHLIRSALLAMSLHVGFSHHNATLVTLDRLVRADEEVRVGKRPAAEAVLAFVFGSKVGVIVAPIELLVELGVAAALVGHCT